MFEIIAWVIAQFFQLTSSYAAAIVMLTVTIRLILFPLTAKQTRSMQNMARVQPQIKALQEEFSNDRQKMNEEVMKFYRENKINPAAGCLPLLLQAPILFGLYRVVSGLSRTREQSGFMIRVAHPQYLDEGSKLYKSLVESGTQMKSLGLDLAQSAQSISRVSGSSFSKSLPYVLMVVLVGVTGYLQQAIANRQQGPATTAQAAQMQKIMKYMPVMFAFISFNIQAAIVLYWIVGNIWMIAQSQVLRKMSPPPIVTSDPIVAATIKDAEVKPSKDKPSKDKLSKDKPSNDAPPKNPLGGSKANGAARPSGSPSTGKPTVGPKNSTGPTVGPRNPSSNGGAAKQAPTINQKKKRK